MNIKKILALTLLILALFACMSTASAGIFDFFGGDESTQTYTFDGFTLDIPESAEVEFQNFSENNPQGYLKKYHYTVKMENGDNFNVSSAEGVGVVSSVEEYTANMVNGGATLEGTYNGWTIIKTNDMPLAVGPGIKVDPDYILFRFSGEKLITIQGDDLNQMKNIADSFKEV